MTDILSQIGTKVGEELKSLSDRVTILEGTVPQPTGNFTVETVTWTNLTEINLSGEKLVNGDFSNTTQLADRFTATGTSNNCYARQVVSVNGTYVQSIEIKEALSSGTSSFMLDQYFNGITGRSRIRIDLNGSSDPTVSVLSYGDVNDVTVTSLADDWYRIDLEITLNSGSAQIRFGALETGDEVFARNASLVANGTTTELLTNNSSFSSGWTLNNTTITQGTGLSLDNWTVTSGSLDQTELANGIVKGDGGAVAIKQIFSQTIPTGTELVLKATRTDTETGNIRFNPIRASDGVVMSTNIGIDPSVGFATYTTTVAISGFKLDTLHGLRKIDSVSVFQGVVSGGSVQTHTGGSIEKISGSGGYNAGASSVQKIDGQKDGYVQFQIAHATSSVKVGLVNQDSDFNVDQPWLINFGGGYIDMSTPFIADHTSYVNGDWFRIRHYSANNEIKFQKREDFYQANASLRASNYSVSDDSDVGDYVVFLKTDVGQQISGTDVAVTLNRGYEIVGYSSASNSLKVLDDNGNNAWLALNNTSSDRNRGDAWEFADNIGQEYFTFYTHPTLTNGSDLYVDVSLHAVGSRINDVQIAYK